MEGIINFNLIQINIPHFKWNMISFILELHYKRDYNKYFEEVFVLDVGFLVNNIGGNRAFKLKIRFKQIEDLCFEAANGAFVQLSGFNIMDIKEDGWSEMRYKINDYENNNFHLFCNQIEVLSVEETKENL